MRQTHQPLFGTSFRKYVSQSVGDLESEARTRPARPHQARTRPAPGPHQGFFSDVTQFDLAGGAGQKRDLRTMEPVSDIIGHCFVVGDTRHQLRASMSAGWRGSAGQVRRNFRQLSPDRTTGNIFFTVVPSQDNWIFFSQLSPHRTTGFFFTVVGLDDNLDIFFLGRIPTLARARQEASMPGRWRGRAPMPGRFAETVGLDDSPGKNHSPPVLAKRAKCAIRVSQGKPLNTHSPPAPCYMCYMCYMV